MTCDESNVDEEKDLAACEMSVCRGNLVSKMGIGLKGSATVMGTMEEEKRSKNNFAGEIVHRELGSETFSCRRDPSIAQRGQQGTVQG